MAVICSNCQYENPVEASFCASCGASLAPTCPTCGRNVGADDRFCPSCGTSLAGTGGPSDVGPAVRSGVEDSQYPVQLSIDYPETSSRLITLFRLILVIPIGLVLGLVSGGISIPKVDAPDALGGAWILGGGGILIAGPLVMILLRRKYPRWWFDWNLELVRFETRVGAFVSLLRDEYPSTDEHQAVHLTIEYPAGPEALNRWLPLIKWLLAIPHYIVLIFLLIAALFAIVFSWFAILFTGRYPRELFNFVVGTTRWVIRVQGYAFLLVTDRYPPLRLGP